MTVDEFVSKYSSQYKDWDGAYGAQCVDLARYYWDEVCEISQPRGVAGAKDFWTNYDSDSNLKNNFKKIFNSPTAVPSKGDVMIWGASYGPWGHIAIFTEGDVNSFKAFSQNDPIGARSAVRNYKNYAGVLGWFHPNKDVTGGSNEPTQPPESEDDMLMNYLGVNSEEEAKKKLAEHLGEKDGLCDWGTDSEDRGGYLGSERRKNKSYAEKVSGLETEIGRLNTELENCSKVEESFEPTGKKEIFHPDGSKTVEKTYKVKA